MSRRPWLNRSCFKKMASTRPDDTAPVASLDHMEAHAAPTHPRAPPGPLGSLPWPPELASGRPKVEELPLFTSRHRPRHAEVDAVLRGLAAHTHFDERRHGLV